MELKLVAFFVGIAVFTSNCHGIFFQCTFSTSNYGEPIGELYACYAQVNMTDNIPSKLTAVLGNHTDQKTNANVRNLQVMSTGLDGGVDRLPSGISRFFPDLVIFQWSYAKLKILSQKDFKPFPNLIQANFQMNMIKKLDGNLFKFNKKLQWIDFSYNAIRVVEKNFFDGLTELTMISFWNNQCLGNMMMPSLYVNQAKAEILWLCAPEEVTECPQQCTDRFVAVESKASAAETKVSELQAFLKIIYELKQ